MRVRVRVCIHRLMDTGGEEASRWILLCVRHHLFPRGLVLVPSCDRILSEEQTGRQELHFKSLEYLLCMKKF